MSKANGQDEVGDFVSLIHPDWPDQPLLALFYIPVPFPLGIPAGSILTLFGDEIVPWLQGTPYQQTEDAPLFVPPDAGDGRVFVSLRTGRRTVPSHMSLWEVEAAFETCAEIFGIKRSRESCQLDSWEALPDAVPRERDVTVFEAVTPLLPAPTADTADVERSVSASFDRCLDALNELLRAYSIMTKDWRVKPLTRQAMALLVPWGTREPDSQKPHGPGVFLVNTGDPLQGAAIPTLSESGVKDLASAVSRRRQGGERGDPISAAVEHARRAQRACYVDGNYSLSLVWSYAWLEALLDGVLLLSAWEEGIEAEEAADWFERPLVKRVTGCFPGRFGGRWYTNQRGSPFGNWERRVARFRHRVVHDNFRATEKEASAALDASGELELYVKERLTKCRAKYPRSALIAMGVPGLKQRKMFDTPVQEAVRDSDAEGP